VGTLDDIKVKPPDDDGGDYDQQEAVRCDNVQPGWGDGDGVAVTSGRPPDAHHDGDVPADVEGKAKPPDGWGGHALYKVPILKRVGEETLRGVAMMLILIEVVGWLLRVVSMPYMMNTMPETHLIVINI
jgi:hypothetical protein